MDLYDTETQLFGEHILDIKKMWLCVQHNGHCWVSPMAEHIGLKPHRLCHWAAAIVSYLPYPTYIVLLIATCQTAGDTSVAAPPNSEEFDVMVNIKSDGAAGPHKSIKSVLATAQADASTALLTAMLLLINNLTNG